MENTRKAYSEVYEFLNKLPRTERNRIPKDVINIFRYYGGKDYKKNIDEKKSISEQNFSNEAINIIAMLNVDYLCDSELEQEFYKNVYKKNEIDYQKRIDVSNIFEKRKKKAYERNENSQLIEYRKGNIFSIFFSKIKNLITN